MHAPVPSDLTLAGKPAPAAPGYTAGKATIELRGVSKGFGHDDEREEVVHDLTLTINPGELTALVAAADELLLPVATCAGCGELAERAAATVTRMIDTDQR